MLFYKIEGVTVNAASEEDRRLRRENIRKIAIKSDEFNQEYCRGTYLFISDVCEGIITAGGIVDQNGNIKDTAHSFLSHLGMEAKDIVITEITLNTLTRLLSTASRQDYIADDDEIMEQFNLDKISGRHNRCVDFGENIIEDRSKDELFSNAERYLLTETLNPELERIYSAPTKVRAYGHPVHYLLQTDDRDTRREVYKILLQALYANNRLRGRRYCFLDLRPGEQFSLLSYDALYKVCDGGAVVVRYLANDDSEDDGRALCESETIEKICEVAKRYRNQVLTVFCLPRVCNKTKDLFYENLGTVSLVELKEEFVSGEKAIDFLKMLAKSSHVRTDKALFSKLEAGKGYLAPDLHQIFDDWFNSKLKSTIYPQYKNVMQTRKAAVKATPKGSAYDELQEMIGLDSAKAVIRKALNYYKMQKLYEEKGVKRDHPAMHMVFSGNPGTAKTTVARLFARIMKDNGLLSKGQLIEVGRGDLVGKYVGSTAPNVQAKFKAASGGVLFIDEAYSLVDDRNGLYGDEAINTIVQEMENHREDVVVIFAGYPDKMEEFISRNPGLRSRIAFHVPFEDYTSADLCKIAELIAKNKGLVLDGEAIDKLSNVFEIARKQGDFGNGRYVRNILEQARMSQATRLLDSDFESISASDVSTIKAEDIAVPEVKTAERRKIGFAV